LQPGKELDAGLIGDGGVGRSSGGERRIDSQAVELNEVTGEFDVFWLGGRGTDRHGAVGEKGARVEAANRIFTDTSNEEAAVRGPGEPPGVSFREVEFTYEGTISGRPDPNLPHAVGTCGNILSSRRPYDVVGFPR
jgi:hypothetical protein